MVGVENGGAGVVGTSKALVSNGRMSNGGAVVLSNGEAASGGAGGGAGAAAGGGVSSGDGGAGEEKVRNPRWMMHETVVLVAAKRRHDEEMGDEYVPAHKKWGAIAVDVKEKGVDRDARQCRKRWSNLYQDYRRIRDWLRTTDVESYWTMRHDKRRDNKLPGSFDAEVYENMDIFLSKKKGITPRTASDAAQPILDSEGPLGLEMGADKDQDQDQDPDQDHDQDHEHEQEHEQDPDQDQDNLDVNDAAVGDGGSGSGSGSLPAASGMEKEQANDSTAEDRKKRHSKWTKHETVVLLVGKSNYDSRAKDQTASSKGIKSDEKWDSISAYCRSEGADRDAQQCRKRWSNLHNGDYKKIRDWQKRTDVESYWSMKSEDRRENKLPGFFDPQVYEVMDKFCTRKGNGDLDGASPAFEELLMAEVQKRDQEEAPNSATPRKGKRGGDVVASPRGTPPSAPDSGNKARKKEQPDGAPAGAPAAAPAAPAAGVKKKRKRAPVSNGVLEAAENHRQENPTAVALPTVIAATATTATTAAAAAPVTDTTNTTTTNPASPATVATATPASTPSSSTKERDTKEQLISILESSGKAMQAVLAEQIQAQIQAYKANSELDRIQRKQQGDNVVNVLTKLAEAMAKIAEKL